MGGGASRGRESTSRPHRPNTSVSVANSVSAPELSWHAQIAGSRPLCDRAPRRCLGRDEMVDSVLQHGLVCGHSGAALLHHVGSRSPLRRARIA